MLRTKRNILVWAARRGRWPPWLHFGGMLAESLWSGDGFPSLPPSPDANNPESLLPGNPSKGDPENMFLPPPEPTCPPYPPDPWPPSWAHAFWDQGPGGRSSCPPLTKPLRGAFHQRLGMKSARGKTAAAALWASNHLPERTLEQSCGPAWAPGLPELWARAQLPLGSHGVAYSLGKSLEEMKGWVGGWNLRMNRCHLHVPELQPEQEASKGQEPFQGG